MSRFLYQANPRSGDESGSPHPRPGFGNDDPWVRPRRLSWCPSATKGLVSALAPEDLFAEPPGPDMFTEPRHRFIARLPDPDEAASALVDLTSAGFRRDEVFVISGDEGIRRMDPAGLHHGLKGRLVRAVDYLAYGEMIEADAAHLEAGGVIISLPARDQNERGHAEEVLRARHASGMRYWGDWTFEDII